MAVRKPSQWLDKVQLYGNTLNHMLIAVICIYTTVLWIQIGNGIYSLHMWLTTIGYNFFMAESLLSLYKQNSWSGLHTRRTKNHLHWILQVLGCAFAFAGMWILYDYRGIRIRSMHAKLGYASNILIIIGVINGSSALWARELGRWVKPVYSKLFHNLTGSLCFVLGMASLIYGFKLSPFRTNAPPDVVLATQAICGVTIVLSMIGALLSMWSQVQGIFPGFFASAEADSDDEQQQQKAAVATVAASVASAPAKQNLA